MVETPLIYHAAAPDANPFTKRSGFNEQGIAFLLCQADTRQATRFSPAIERQNQSAKTETNTYIERKERQDFYFVYVEGKFLRKNA